MWPWSMNVCRVWSHVMNMGYIPDADYSWSIRLIANNLMNVLGLQLVIIRQSSSLIACVVNFPHTSPPEYLIKPFDSVFPNLEELRFFFPPLTFWCAALINYCKASVRCSDQSVTVTWAEPDRSWCILSPGHCSFLMMVYEPLCFSCTRSTSAC